MTINVKVPWKRIVSAPRDGTRIIVYRIGDDRDPIGSDFWRDGTWWKSRKCFPPSYWCHVDEIRPRVPGDDELAKIKREIFEEG